MADVFLSYARADSRDFVARLSAALEARGKDTWVDLDDIPAASVWTEDLRAGIAGSDSFCFVISPASVGSPHCRAELDHAVATGKRILPVLHLTVPDADVPAPVAARNWIPQTGRFDDDFDATLDTLVTAVETDLDWVREHTRWGLRAEEWGRRGEDRSVLARGSDLDQAEAFLSGGGGREPQPTELQGRYVLASRRAASRRQRQVVIAVSVALVVSLVLGVFALLQRNTAVEQRREAEKQRAAAVEQRAEATSRALAANAFLNITTDPELSLLLGLQAARASATAEAEQALRSALLVSQVRLSLRQTDAVNSADYSPDGSEIVTTSRDGTGALWSAEDGSKIADLEGHTQPPQQAAWSADGARVATIAADGITVVYDGRTGAQVSSMTDPDENRLTDVALSADGKVVVTSAFVNGEIRFWNADDGTLLGSIPRSTVDGIALSPDNSLLLVAQQGEGVELFSTDDGTVVASWPQDAQQFFTSVAWTADGSEFVTAGADGLASVRALDGTLLATVQHDAEITSVAFSADGARLATASQDGTAKVTDLSDGRTLSTFAGHEGTVASVALSPNGRLAATGGEDGAIRLWRPDSGAQVADLVGHRAPVNQVEFSPSGDALVSASDDSTARVWSTAGTQAAFPQDSTTGVPGAYESVFSTHGDFATVTLQPDGDTGPYVVQTFDVGSGQMLGQFPRGDELAVVGLSADGQLTVTTDNAGSSVRRTSDGSPVATVAVTRAYDAAFDPTGTRVLVVGEAGQAGIYDTADGQPLQQLVGHDPDREVVGAGFSPDGSEALTASVDGTVRVWDASSGKQLLEIDAFEPPPNQYLQHATVAISPDGSVLATSAEYETDVRLWDARTGDQLYTLEGGKTGGVRDLSFSADGRFVVTAPYSGALQLWDPSTGRPLAAVTDLGDTAGAVTFVGGSQEIALVGSGQDPALRTLSCSVCGDLDSLVELAKTRVTRELTDAEKATYLLGG